MAELAYLASAILTHLVTNFDNLAVLLILSSRIGPWTSSLAYSLSQIIVLALALALAEYIGDLGAWTRYFGLLPLTLGIYFILTQQRANAGANSRRLAAAGFGAAIVTFLGLGLDTLTVFAPLLADGGKAWDMIALAGAAISIAFLSSLSIILSNTTIALRQLPRMMSMVAPYAMILVGVYVLMDTATDLD